MQGKDSLQETAREVRSLQPAAEMLGGSYSKRMQNLKFHKDQTWFLCTQPLKY